MHDSFFHLKSISFIFSKHLLSAKIIFCISKWAFYSFSLFSPPFAQLCASATTFAKLRYWFPPGVLWDLSSHEIVFPQTNFSFSSSVNHNHQCSANCKPNASAHTQTCKWMHTHIHAAYHNLKVIMNASKSASLFLYHLKNIILAAYSECALSVSNSVDFRGKERQKARETETGWHKHDWQVHMRCL